MLIPCPICESIDITNLFNLNCGSFDDSPLYKKVRLCLCLKCGHIFNELTPKEIGGLAKYYSSEYANYNLKNSDKTSDRPGSENSSSRGRYEQLYSSFKSHIDLDSNILDIGCALGGFLDFLHAKGFTKLFGVDNNQTYIDNVEQKNNRVIKFGDAESLPFEDHTFDVVIMEQVLEHLHEPAKAFDEIRRVLKKNGILCVGVPDAARYNDYYFFDFYWLLMREHIQHFDPPHLALLGEQTGFKSIDSFKLENKIIGNEMIMPTIYTTFRKTKKSKTTKHCSSNLSELKEKMLMYINTEKTKQASKRREIKILENSQKSIYVWGIGREFLYLYVNGLDKCNILGLIDSNPFKQKNHAVNGMKISDAKNLLSKANIDSGLLIAANAYTSSISKTAKSLGYSGSILGPIIRDTI